MSPRPQSAPASEALVDLAIELLEGGGPEAVTLRSVAEAAGVSTQVLYSRFGSKAELLVAMAAVGLDRLDDALAEVPAPASTPSDTLASTPFASATRAPTTPASAPVAAPGASPTPSGRQDPTDRQAHQHSGQPDPADLARAYQRFARAHPHVYDLLFSPGLDKHAQPALAAASERVMARFLAAVAQYRPDPAEAWHVVQLSWASTHGVISLERSGHLSDPEGELVARVTRALLADHAHDRDGHHADHPHDDHADHPHGHHNGPPAADDPQPTHS